MKLDLKKIEGLQEGPDKATGRCPACAEDGGDRKMEHLAIFPSGKFCCAVNGDKKHNRRIIALVGIKGGNRLRKTRSGKGSFLGRELSFSRPCYPKLDASGKAPIKHTFTCPPLGITAGDRGGGNE